MSPEIVDLALVGLGVVAGAAAAVWATVRALLPPPPNPTPPIPTPPPLDPVPPIPTPPPADGDAHQCHPKATAKECLNGVHRTLYVCSCGRREWWDD